jgi:hypothetical protein
MRSASWLRWREGDVGGVGDAFGDVERWWVGDVSCHVVRLVSCRGWAKVMGVTTTRRASFCMVLRWQWVTMVRRALFWVVVGWWWVSMTRRASSFVVVRWWWVLVTCYTSEVVVVRWWWVTTTCRAFGELPVTCSSRV